MSVAGLAMSPYLRVGVMLGVFAVLFVLPIRMHVRQLMSLAFALWFIGGLMLVYLGLSRLLDPAAGLVGMALVLAIGISSLIGMAKGRFILAKTSARNITRLQALTEPQPPRNVYSMRSWIVIALMIGLSVSLTVFNAPPVWRGVVNLAVGFGLIMSSLNYLSAMRNCTAPSAS